MAIPGLTYRLQNGGSLSHLEMDNNFRSLFYSSSVHDDGESLRLHFDTGAIADYHSIPLSGGTGGVTIQGNVDNRVVTATGTPGLIQGEAQLTFTPADYNGVLYLRGRFEIGDGDYTQNIYIGKDAGTAQPGEAQAKNVAIGECAANAAGGNRHVVVGHCALLVNTVGHSNTILGNSAFDNNTFGNRNVAIGYKAGYNNTSGHCNIYIGRRAGSTTQTVESDKLYINNNESDTPLILGDFSTGQVTFNSQVSASIFSGSYYGDGSNLTGVTATAEWDGSRDGDASITGSLVVSGSLITVDLTSTLAISGSVFSGSFVGDGSGLTGISADTFPFTGSAGILGDLKVNGPTEITGSLIVSGSNPIIELKGKTIIDKSIEIHNGGLLSTTAIGKGIFLNAANVPSNSLFIGDYSGCSANSGDGNTVVGHRAGTRAAEKGTLLGYKAAQRNSGNGIIAIGYRALGSINIGTGTKNIAIGCAAMGGNPVTGTQNVGIGDKALYVNQKGNYNISIGAESLKQLIGTTSSNGNRNLALGFRAGQLTKYGNGNVYIGYSAGPSIPDPGQNYTSEDNKLYISNASGYPLIGGDFSTPSVTISGSLLVSQSITACELIGDGSGLTNLPQSEWDGSRDGNASITGSFVVSGSNVTVDFTNTNAISGSVFSGSFVGDGSGLTGITSVSEWDGSRDGNASITGSLIVSGALDVADVVTISSYNYPGGPGIEIIHVASGSLSGVHGLYSFPISSTGYTGFKADYSLTDNTEDDKKIGTLLGSWDQSGEVVLNDKYTDGSVDVSNTQFNLTSTGNLATLTVNASTGTYDLNMLITAFKRQV